MRPSQGNTTNHRRRSEHHDDSTVSNLPGHGRTFDRFLSVTGRRVDQMIAKFRDYEDGLDGRLLRETLVPKSVHRPHQLYLQLKVAPPIHNHKGSWRPTLTSITANSVPPHLPSHAKTLIINATYRFSATLSALEMARRDTHFDTSARKMWSAAQPLRMEQDESGQVVMRRAPDDKLYSDLLRFNSTVDELTVDIIQAIDSDFIFSIPKPMMHDILDQFKGTKNAAWIEEVLLTRERIDSISALRHAGQCDHRRNERRQVIGHRQSSVDKPQIQDTRGPPLRIYNSDLSSESVDTLHVPSARLTSALSHSNSPSGAQLYYEKGYPAPATPHDQAFYGAAPQERSRWATAHAE